MSEPDNSSSLVTPVTGLDTLDRVDSDNDSVIRTGLLLWPEINLTEFLSHDSCDSWAPVSHIYFQIANLFLLLSFLAPYGLRGLLYLRSALGKHILIYYLIIPSSLGYFSFFIIAPLILDSSTSRLEASQIHRFKPLSYSLT